MCIITTIIKEKLYTLTTSEVESNEFAVYKPFHGLARNTFWYFTFRRAILISVPFLPLLH